MLQRIKRYLSKRKFARELAFVSCNDHYRGHKLVPMEDRFAYQRAFVNVYLAKNKNL